MIDSRYWDADPFLSWLMEEPGRVEKCGRVISAAEAGDLVIVTSALTIAEVLWVPGLERPSFDKSSREKIRRFFEHDYIKVVHIDRTVAELAQEVVWDHGVKPKDALHVASALRAKCPVLDTFDSALIELDGQVGGNPPLRIGEPNLPPEEHQEELFPEEG